MESGEKKRLILSSQIYKRTNVEKTEKEEMLTHSFDAAKKEKTNVYEIMLITRNEEFHLKVGRQ